VASAWFLGLALFIATLGVGYLTWSLMTWRQGRTPAQRMLGLRCWLPLEGRVAGRRDMAVRQISGACLNGQLLSGLFVWLFGEPLRSVGDVFADTMVMYDPDGILTLRRRRALTPAELTLAGGPLRAHRIEKYTDDEDPPRLRWRAEFRRDG
jgi:uncharacterized RDD family membrane protein YckC